MIIKEIAKASRLKNLLTSKTMAGIVKTKEYRDVLLFNKKRAGIDTITTIAIQSGFL